MFILKCVRSPAAGPRPRLILQKYGIEQAKGLVFKEKTARRKQGGDAWLCKSGSHGDTYSKDVDEYGWVVQLHIVVQLSWSFWTLNAHFLVCRAPAPVIKRSYGKVKLLNSGQHLNFHVYTLANMASPRSRGGKGVDTKDEAGVRAVPAAQAEANFRVYHLLPTLAHGLQTMIPATAAATAMTGVVPLS
eukprot:COSAG05_NODE_2410_length_3097_cov_1.279186_2_plen_189_part_00